MSGRDHSETCTTCGFERGGLNDVLCACDLPFAQALIAERDHALTEINRLQLERDEFAQHHKRVVDQRNKDWDALMILFDVVAAAETWAMEREPRVASAHALSEAVLAMRADRRESVASNSSCECAARGGKHASFCPAKES